MRRGGRLQAFPRANGGRFEKKAKEILREKLQIPVTTACEMSDEVDVLRRGAGTLLNTRLIPLTANFQAVNMLCGNGTCMCRWRSCEVTEA